MNGAVIGIAVVITHQAHHPILPDQLQALTACFVGLVGSSMLRAAECRIATAASQTTATAAAASALSSVLSLIKKPNSLKLKIRAKTQFPNRASGTARKGELLFLAMQK